MTFMTLITGYGPNYILGFVITFFTLMSCRHLTGFNIYPQERIVRIMLVSMLWMPALVICTILAYVRRSDKLDAAMSETEDLRRQLEEAKQMDKAVQEEIAEVTAPTDHVVAASPTAEVKKVKKARTFSW